MYYPHTFTANIYASGTRDIEGDWEGNTSPVSVLTGNCRYEAGGRHLTETIVVDGVEVKPDGIIYLPLNADVPAKGSEITIVTNTETINAKVLQFSKGLFNTRVWV